MNIQEPAESPERKNTDEGLREEREKADEALVVTQESIDDDADAVVELARDHADAVLTAAREKADEDADSAAPFGIPSASVARERAIEDEVLSDERAIADERVRRERAESARLLHRHLPLERDATDQYLLTERARSDDAIANRDDFLGMVCHDLRDLLNGVVISSALLAEKLKSGADDNQGLVETARIQRYAARMNRLIGDLVDVASIDAGKLAVAPLMTDASALVLEVVDGFHDAAAAKNISLEALGAQNSLMAIFDHDRLLQVLANLVTNSIKFTPGGGTIRVHCGYAGDKVEFSVSDTGEGIPDNMLEAIFERFWQAGKNDRRGLGLGLYISKCIVEAHGGTIRAESKLGARSRVYFTVPLEPVFAAG